MITKGLSVRFLSPKGDLLAVFYNTTERNAGMSVEIKEQKTGGLDTATLRLANNFDDPLYNDMECQVFQDGEHWFTFYAESVPELDSDSAAVEIVGKGYWHKLKNAVVNESYTAQTLEYIVNDIASNYLGASLGVLYDVLKIEVPTVSSLDIEFNDKKLDEVFESLLQICNAEYSTAQYRAYVDLDRYLVFELLPAEASEILFEGFDFQEPDVEQIEGKIVNTVLAYRTTAADASATEYVATYSDADSVTQNGAREEKLIFPDYIVDAGIQRIAEALIDKYKDPLTRVTVQNFEVSEPRPYLFHRIVNKRVDFYRTVAMFEDLNDWDTTGLSSTVASISDEQALTGRTSLKLACSVGSQDETMKKTLPVPVYFPSFFRVYNYRVDAAAKFIVRLADSFGNTIDIPVGANNEPTGEWIKYDVRIGLETDIGNMIVTESAGNEGRLKVTVSAGTEGFLCVQTLVVDGIVNLSEIRIIMDHASATTSYFDQFSVRARAYKEHQLLLEEATYSIGKAALAELIFGDEVDSLIDEIKNTGESGKTAFSVFSKQ